MTYEDGNSILTMLMIAFGVTLGVILLAIVFIMLKSRSNNKSVRMVTQNMNELNSNFGNAKRQSKLQKKIRIAEAKGKLGSRYLEQTREYTNLAQRVPIQEQDSIMANPRLQNVPVRQNVGLSDATMLVQMQNIELQTNTFGEIVELLKSTPKVGAFVPDNIKGDPPFTLGIKDFSTLPAFLMDNGVRLVGVSYVRPTSSNIASNVVLRFRYASKLLQKRIDIHFNQTDTSLALARVSSANIYISPSKAKKSLEYFIKRGVGTVKLIGPEVKGLIVTDFSVASYDETAHAAIFNITITGIKERTSSSTRVVQYAHSFDRRKPKRSKNDNVQRLVSRGLAPTINPADTSINFRKHFGEGFKLKKIWFDNKDFELDKEEDEVRYKILFDNGGMANISETIAVKFAYCYNEYIIRNIHSQKLLVKNYPIFLGTKHHEVNYNKYKDIFRLEVHPEAKIKFNTKQLNRIIGDTIDIDLDITLGNYQTTVPVELYEVNGIVNVRIKGANNG